MSYVAINVLTVAPEMGAHLEERFAARAGMVEGSDGFEGFQLLRPVEGTEKYFVFTRWASKADFEKWRDGAGAVAHQRERESQEASGESGGQGHGHGGQQQATMSAELWAFDVVLDVQPKN